MKPLVSVKISLSDKGIRSFIRLKPRCGAAEGLRMLFVLDADVKQMQKCCNK